MRSSARAQFDQHGAKGVPAGFTNVGDCCSLISFLLQPGSHDFQLGQRLVCFFRFHVGKVALGGVLQEGDALALGGIGHDQFGTVIGGIVSDSKAPTTARTSCPSISSTRQLKARILLNKRFQRHDLLGGAVQAVAVTVDHRREVVQL